MQQEFELAALPILELRYELAPTRFRNARPETLREEPVFKDALARSAICAARWAYLLRWSADTSCWSLVGP
ncbi:MAG: hypothetical protein NTZ61_12840 [Proteobacteria bacterium]|nr:hypothetical protein [Pseudomonadota bacterium]